jgi:hypothetical protein
MGHEIEEVTVGYACNLRTGDTKFIQNLGGSTQAKWPVGWSRRRLENNTKMILDRSIMWVSESKIKFKNYQNFNMTYRRI